MQSRSSQINESPLILYGKEIALLSAILALAMILRLYDLQQLPPGLHFDEAFDAINAQKVMTGAERPIFFPDNLGEEPLSIYAAAAVFAVLGPSPWSLRASSALAGIINVAALYVLARGLLPWSREKRIAAAALAALVLAILYWHINFSRLGMEPIFLPLMLTLSLLFLWQGVSRATTRAGNIQPATLVHFVLAGVFLGGAEFSYKAGWFVPFFIVAFFMLETVVNSWLLIRCWRGLAVFAAAAVLVFAPLGIYFWTKPEVFLDRPTAVTAMTLNPAALADNALRVAAMFVIRGDENPRSNLPGRPVLDPFLAIGFVIGLAACLLRARPRRSANRLDSVGSRLALLWLVVMVLPSALTDYAPHFGRSIGVTPVVALLTATGFVELYEWVRAKLVGSSGQIRKLAPIVLICILMVGLSTSAYSTVHAYFYEWGNGTGLFESFDVGYLAMAYKLRDRPANESVYVSPFAAQHYTIEFGLGEREGIRFDGRRALVLPPPGSIASYGIVTREDSRTLDRLADVFPDGSIVETIRDLTGTRYASLFRAQGAPQIAPQRHVGALLDYTMQLIGYDVKREADAIGLTIYWGCIAETPTDYTVFVHLIGDVNPGNQSLVWAQDDAMPGHGTYPTSRWQAGQVIVDEYRLVLPKSIPPGEYEIEVGMYTVQTGVRVPAFHADGAPMENDRVLFERITLP